MQRQSLCVTNLRRMRAHSHRACTSHSVPTVAVVASLLFLLLLGDSKALHTGGHRRISERVFAGGRPCVRGSEMDLVFAIDSSRSVSPQNFIKVLNFVKSVMQSFPIGPEQPNRAGLVVYGSVSNVRASLNSHASLQSFFAMVDATQPLGKHASRHLLHVCIDLSGQPGAQRLGKPSRGRWWNFRTLTKGPVHRPGKVCNLKLYDSIAATLCSFNCGHGRNRRRRRRARCRQGQSGRGYQRSSWHWRKYVQQC